MLSPMDHRSYQVVACMCVRSAGVLGGVWFAWLWVTLRSVWASVWVVLSSWYERLEWVGCLGYNNVIGLL